MNFWSKYWLIYIYYHIPLFQRISLKTPNYTAPPQHDRFPSPAIVRIIGPRRAGVDVDNVFGISSGENKENAALDASGRDIGSPLNGMI